MNWGPKDAGAPGVRRRGRLRAATLALFVAAAASGAAAAEAVDTSAWRRTMDLRFSGCQAGAALTDFPILVVFDATNQPGFHHADVQPQGRDLCFTDASNTVLLAHEIESWNTNGPSHVWVRIPALTSNTLIRAFWSNPAATSATPDTVWDSAFRAVWHLAGTGDSTDWAHHGTNVGATAGTGTVNGARLFDGNDYLDFGNPAALNITNNQITLSAWIKPASISGNTIVGKSYSNTHVNYYYAWILYTVSGSLHCRLDTTTITSGALSTGRWQHVAATYDGSAVRLYVNGQLAGSVAKTGNLQATTRHVRIGGRDTSPLGEYFNGGIDDVRVSAAGRSADWIRAENDTVASNATFCAYGPVSLAQPDLPEVTAPLGATNVLATRATLTGMLVHTGSTPATVWLCWDTNDAGRSFGAWAQRTSIGERAPGPFSLSVTGLVSGTPYVYRCRAANASGEAWSVAHPFTPSAPRLTVSNGQVVEGAAGTVVMRFLWTLSRPDPDDLSFHCQTTTGTAGGDNFTPFSGAVSVPAGQTNGFIEVLVHGNATEQSDRVFYLDFSGEGFVFPTARVQGLILDDDGDRYLSPVALAADAGRSRLYVAEEEGLRIGVVDTVRNELLETIPLADPPRGLALSPDGSLLYVAAGGATGRIHAIDLATSTVIRSFPAGHTPGSPAVSSDGGTLYVCNRFDGDVSVIGLPEGTLLARIPLVREPCAAALSPDGARLFVANLLPGGSMTNALVSGTVSVIDTAARTVVQQIPLPPGSHSLRGLCVSATARGVRVYVTHVLSRYYAPTTQLTRGWMNTAALSVIDATTGALLNTVLLDDLDLGAANPWGVAASADGVWICVAHAGTHEISAIDQGALLEQLQTSGTADTPQDLTFLRDARRRLPLRGAGPRGVAVVGNRAYAAEYFSGTVGVVELAPGNEQGAEEIVVGWRKPMDLRRQGEGNYHDARLCLQQWQSCASCHPDARADGLNWDLLNDGFGNPKNTKGHVASWLTPPVMATGIRKDARTAVRSGLKYIGFVNAPEAQAAAIDEYLRLLPATPSPRLVGGALSAAAVRGQAVFQSVGCAGCHSGPQFTDLQKHDVGTGLGREAGWLFDTPTLIEAWRTAPYLHDGRAPTVREVIVTVQAARVAGLTTEQIDDLVEYVLSL